MCFVIYWEGFLTRYRQKSIDFTDVRDWGKTNSGPLIQEIDDNMTVSEEYDAVSPIELVYRGLEKLRSMLLTDASV